MELDFNRDCPICFEPLLTEWIQVTCCHHLFHEKCLALWLGGGGRFDRCPTCRTRTWLSTILNINVLNKHWFLWCTYTSDGIDGPLVFNIQAADGRGAVAQIPAHSRFHSESDKLGYASAILELLDRIPRLNIRAVPVPSPPHSGYQKVIHKVDNVTTAEETRSFRLNGSDDATANGPFLWREGDHRTETIQQMVDQGPEFSLTWIDFYGTADDEPGFGSLLDTDLNAFD